MKPKLIPPRLAQRILSGFLRDDLAEEVLGDLEEKFYAMAKRSSFRANVNYWFQVFNYLRPFAIRKSKPRTMFYSGIAQSYFKIGWRNLLKNKGYSSINIGGLAMGMTVAMLIGLWIYDELSFNRWHQNYKAIGKVMRHNNWREGRQTNHYQVMGLGTHLRTSYPGNFERVVMIRETEGHVIAFGEKKFTQSGNLMEAGAPHMLTLNMVHGTRNGLNDKNSIFLSRTLAKKLFGDTDPLNAIVTIDAEKDVKVTGVYEDLPSNSEFREATFIAPLELYFNPEDFQSWNNYNISIYVQIAEKADFEKISSIIKNDMLTHVDEVTAASTPELFLLPMDQWHLHSKFEAGVQVPSERMRAVLYYGMIGGFVLLLACINFMNLSTARSEKRAKEVGIRKSIGSLRKQLIQQFFGESLLVAVFAFLFALLLMQLALPFFNQVADKHIVIPWFNFTFWLAGFGFTLLTGFLAGSYPAFYLSAFNPVSVLKGSFRVGRSASAPRRVLVVVQFTVSISLIIGTVIVYQQIQFAKNRAVGYSREGLIMLPIQSPEFTGKYDLLRDELKKTGVVFDMAQSGRSIMDIMGWNGGFDWEGRPSGFSESFNTIWVSYDYGSTIGWQFLEGRDFTRDVASDTAAVIINESALKLMGLKDPVGTILRWETSWQKVRTFEIIGVVKDMVKGSPFEHTYPSIIFHSQAYVAWTYVKIDPSVSASEALPKIEAVFNRLIPSAPFDYQFAGDAYDAKFKSEQRIGTLASVFSVLAIIISCMGLFGLASFVAEQRTKEIGIRKVLGASIAHVWVLLSKEFVMLVIVACVISIPLSYAFMDNWLQGYEYRTPIRWVVFLSAGTGAMMVTLLTVSFQAVKAAMANPVNSLKTE
jgi:ABC-type antimicrobial peptide transport system permease subunit